VKAFPESFPAGKAFLSSLHFGEFFADTSGMPMSTSIVELFGRGSMCGT